MDEGLAMKEHFGHITDFYALTLAYRYALEKNFDYCLVGLAGMAEFQGITPFEASQMFVTFCLIQQISVDSLRKE